MNLRMMAWFFVLLLSTVVSISSQAQTTNPEKLVFAIDIVRHGDRNPVASLPASPIHWAGGLEQLTPIGMQQEFQRGTEFRKKYVDEFHLLPANYQPETMYVRSTNLDRTLMSAESILYGLYPLGAGPKALPNAYQPIPVHTIKKEDETLLIPDQNRLKFDTLVILHVIFTTEWRDKQNQLKDKFKEWSRLTGVPIHSLVDLLDVGDNLNIRQIHHLPLPKGMSNDEANEIIRESQWAFTHLFASHAVGASASADLLSQMKDYIQMASQKKSPLKYVLYTAHDTTILSMMSALDAPLHDAPPYASDLNVSLFEKANQYYVKISYNNKLVTVPACNGSTCTLSEFLAIT